jgi:hypothetical protein
VQREPRIDEYDEQPGNRQQRNRVQQARTFERVEVEGQLARRRDKQDADDGRRDERMDPAVAGHADAFRVECLHGL